MLVILHDCSLSLAERRSGCTSTGEVGWGPRGPQRGRTTSKVRRVWVVNGTACAKIPLMCACPKRGHLSSSIFPQTSFLGSVCLYSGSLIALPCPSVVVSLRPGTQDGSAIAVEPVQEIARTHGSEMVSKRFCVGQDAEVLATYTPGRTGQLPSLHRGTCADRKMTKQ